MHDKLNYHLKKSTMYFTFALKYMYIDPQIHHHYYLKHLKHATKAEALYKALKQDGMLESSSSSS
jgi:hypothetical protein